ncbi:MAG: hypothetical protein V4665_00285 [Patescibacteria group bacterium]
MNTTIGVFKTHAEAGQAINELHAFGVPESDMSYVYVNADGNIVDAHTDSKIGSGVATGAATGSVIGAIAGLVVANGILPGLGSLIVAGPLAAALGFTGAAATAVAGAATGAAAGGLIGALGNVGVSDADAVIYENFVRAGEILVIVNSSTLVTKDVFLKAGAREIREYMK